MTDTPSYTEITLLIIDGKGSVLFGGVVPFSPKMNVTQVMESAFILAQNGGTPDPFRYMVEYYGYSEFIQFPGYLGYEIESIQVGTHPVLANNDDFFWQLSINKVVSQSGADTSYPAPASTVLWQYVPVPDQPDALPPRTAAILKRRAGRS